MKKTRLTLFLLFIFLLPVSITAFDFRVILNQYAGYGYLGSSEDHFKYQADIVPRFSSLIGDTGELYLSAGITLRAENDFYIVPELLRTEFSMSFDNSRIRAGRISYADPLSFIANGLFDGAQYSYYSGAGTFRAGAWYTGLLYKRTANITMTDNDQALYYSALDYGDFFDTYFAPPRLLFSIDWEHPSIADLISLRSAFTGQFDLSDADEKYHSQYLTVKAAVPFNSFSFEAGLSLETAQVDDFAIAFAWDLGIYWTLPTSFSSRLLFTAAFAGGRADGVVRAFVPVTTNTFGNILEAKLSALTVLALNYTARIVETVGASMTASYFIRNDLETYRGWPLSGADSDGYVLGAELFARATWSPFSDLQLNLGIGTFLPSLGDASDENAKWRIELGAIWAVY